MKKYEAHDAATIFEPLQGEEFDRLVSDVRKNDLRRTFVDLLRAAGADAVVEHAVVGHSDEAMRRRYSTVRGDEAARAVGAVVALVGVDSGVDKSGGGK